MKISDLHLFNWVRDRKDVKVLRHRDPKTDLWELRRLGKFQDLLLREQNYPVVRGYG